MSKVKHIALFRFKEGTTEEQINRVFDDLLDLTENVAGVEDYVSGTNNSPESLNKGFTHGFVMTFSDAPARDAYLANSDHERVKSLLLANIDDGLVFDFEV